MVRPSAQLPVSTGLHSLEGLGLFAEQSKAATGSAFGFPGRSKRGVVIHLNCLVLRTRKVFPQHKGFLYRNDVMLKVKGGIHTAPATWVDTTYGGAWISSLRQMGGNQPNCR
eukprot:1464721-Amphidinium_carterae.1